MTKMTLPAVAKIGGAGIVAAGVPTTIYFTHDHIFLHKTERDVISGDEKLTIGEHTGSGSDGSNVEVKVSQSNKWSCIIKATIVNGSGATVTDENAKNKLKKYLEKYLPSTATDANTDPKVSEEDRKANKRKLVWDCSWNRATPGSDNSISAELKITLKKNNDNLTSTLFGKETELKE